jgi:hypothetical protein
MSFILKQTSIRYRFMELPAICRRDPLDVNQIKELKSCPYTMKVLAVGRLCPVHIE